MALELWQSYPARSKQCSGAMMYVPLSSKTSLKRLLRHVMLSISIYNRHIYTILYIIYNMYKIYYLIDLSYRQLVLDSS